MDNAGLHGIVAALSRYPTLGASRGRPGGQVLVNSDDAARGRRNGTWDRVSQLSRDVTPGFIPLLRAVFNLKLSRSLKTTVRPELKSLLNSESSRVLRAGFTLRLKSAVNRDFSLKFSRLLSAGFRAGFTRVLRAGFSQKTLV